MASPRNAVIGTQCYISGSSLFGEQRVWLVEVRWSIRCESTLLQRVITYFFCKEKGQVPVFTIPNREKGVAHQTEDLSPVKKIDLVCYYTRTSAAYITISLILLQEVHNIQTTYFL